MYLLDTNVVSELRKARTNKIDTHVNAWARTVHISDLHISVITVQEIQTSILLKARKDPKQAKHLQEWFDGHVLKTFQNRIIPIDETVAILCADLHVPDRRSYADSLIATSAIHHKLTLVTRNIADFQEFRVNLINPWIKQ